MSWSADILGAEALVRKLRAIDAKMERRIIRRALAPAANLVRQAIRAEAPRGKTGKLARSVRITDVKVREAGVRRTVGVLVKPRTRYTHLVLMGSKPHAIAAKGRSLRVGPLLFGARVQHPGARANAFIGRAIDRVHVRATELVREGLAKFTLDAFREG